VRDSPPKLDQTDSEPALLTFYDLVELCFVRDFDRCGVTLPLIRAAAQNLHQEWRTTYPCVFNRIQTDGSDFILDAGEQYRRVATCRHVFACANEFSKYIDVHTDGVAE